MAVPLAIAVAWARSGVSVGRRVRVTLSPLAGTAFLAVFLLPLLLAGAAMVGGALVRAGVLRPGARVPLDLAVDLPRWAPLAMPLILAGGILLATATAAHRIRRGRIRLALLTRGLALFWGSRSRSGRVAAT